MLKTADDAIAGARDIIAESISDEAETELLSKNDFEKATIVTKGR